MHLLLLLMLLPFQSRAEFCAPGTPAGEKCRVLLKDLRPTQFGLGMVDVNEKWRILHGMGRKKRVLYLKENRAKVVIGPGGTFYIIDRHHLSRAAYMEGLEETYAEIVDNLSDLSEEEFWKKMKTNHWVYLRDARGQATTIDKLPRHLRDLQDDPFRSLAWIVRNSEGFAKTDIPFAEFEWAEYFAKESLWEPHGKIGDKAVKEAIRLATETKARLPGQIRIPPRESTLRQEHCWHRFQKLSVSYP